MQDDIVWIEHCTIMVVEQSEDWDIQGRCHKMMLKGIWKSFGVFWEDAKVWNKWKKEICVYSWSIFISKMGINLCVCVCACVRGCGCRTVASVETVDHVRLAVDRAPVGTWTTLSVTAATSSVTRASVVRSAAKLTGISHSPRCCCAPSANGELLVFDSSLLTSSVRTHCVHEVHWSLLNSLFMCGCEGTTNT